MKPIANKPPRRFAKSARILYVEDEDENWEVANLRMGRSYELARARTDQEVCEILRASGAAFGAVLMDIQLSGSQLDGIQLTKLMRGTLPAAETPAYARDIGPLPVPIIFMTAYAARYSEAELLAVGGDSVMPKPVNFVALNLALTRVFLDRTSRLGERRT